MPKFFVPPEAIRGSTVYMGKNNAAHVRALRLRPREEITVSSGGPEEYRCVYLGVEEGDDVAEIVSQGPCEAEPRTRVVLYTAMPKGDKPELITQKAVELGADRICFFLSSRCISRPDDKAVRKKLERLNRISEEAAMQSGRGCIPAVHWLDSFGAMAAEAAKCDLKLFLWEEARETSLRSALRSAAGARSVALVTGPEGGFSREEAEMAVRTGLLPVTLGKRILRCETAPLCALSAVMYETGDLE